MFCGGRDRRQQEATSTSWQCLARQGAQSTPASDGSVETNGRAQFSQADGADAHVQRQQRPLALQPAGRAGERAASAAHAVAGHQQGGHRTNGRHSDLKLLDVANEYAHESRTLRVWKYIVP